ncbi:hypothetical protein PHISP_02835 [Aspergillus sp. HF37]|nr:hypothetical protein PHISP_02835 [Aspergillus sp. HF37]
MCKFNPGNCRDLDYLDYLEATCAKLVGMRKDISALKECIPKLTTELDALRSELHTLTTEHNSTKSTRAALKTTLRDLSTDLQSVRHELAGDPSNRWLCKPVDCNTRVWLLAKQGAVEDEISTAERERDDQLIERALIVDKKAIVRDGIEQLEHDIVHYSCRLAELEEEAKFTGLQRRWGERKYDAIHELENAAR